MAVTLPPFSSMQPTPAEEEHTNGAASRRQTRTSPSREPTVEERAAAVELIEKWRKVIRNFEELTERPPRTKADRERLNALYIALAHVAKTQRGYKHLNELLSRRHHVPRAFVAARTLVAQCAAAQKRGLSWKPDTRRHGPALVLSLYAGVRASVIGPTIAKVVDREVMKDKVSEWNAAMTVLETLAFGSRSDFIRRLKKSGMIKPKRDPSSKRGKT